MGKTIKYTYEIEIINLYGFVYITTNIINGKKYIGQKIFDNRWKSYLGSGIHLKSAIKKYGKENFSREIIAIAYSKEELNKLEIMFIKEHDAVKSNDYYNISSGGGTNAGLKMSEETRKKMSEANKGQKCYMYGKPKSEETRKKLSLANKGKKLSKETKKKIGDAKRGEKNHNYGKHLLDETKLKLSKVNKGKKLSEETKGKMSESGKGKPKSEQHKQNISLALKGNKSYMYGKHHSKETKDKISKSAIKLNNEQIIEIREKYISGDYTYEQLANEYNVGHTTIGRIIKFNDTYAK